MAFTGIHSTDAKRYVRIAQFAGVGLGVLAAALWAMDVPGLTRQLPAKPQPRSDSSSQTPIATVTLVNRIEPDSPMGIQERLESALRRPAVQHKDPETAPPPPPIIQQTGPAWRYLGPIRESKRILALVSIDGAQKFLSVGSVVTQKTPAAEGRPESLYQATVSTVESDFIEIDESGKSRRIDLDGRTSRVSWVKNMPTTVAGANGPAVAGLSAETRQRLAAQGIDPAAAERARIAAVNASLASGRNRASANAGNTPGSLNPNILGASTIVGGATQSKNAIPPSDATDAANGAKGSATGTATKKKSRTDAETVN